MRILYIGNGRSGTTSKHRADALLRIGHEVKLIDPFLELSDVFSSRFFGAFHFRSGYRLLQGRILRWMSTAMAKAGGLFDLIWVDGGELLGAQVLQLLKNQNVPIVLYNIDDPTGNRDGHRWDSLRAALPYYDLCVGVREETVVEYGRFGARRSIRVWRSFDEVAHCPLALEELNKKDYSSDVVFVGTWMRNEGRDLFLRRLIEGGINVSIWGDRWNKAPGWDFLKPHWRGPALSGENYVSAIQSSKIALGLLSHGNRDLHTTRSAEIPYARGLLCAERTSEHLLMYEEGKEAFFWSDAEECILVCKRLLADDHLRNVVVEAGRQRAIKGGYGNEEVCRAILEKVHSMSGHANDARQ